MDIDSISVIDGWFPTVVVVLTIVGLLASLGWRSTRTRRRRRSVTSSDEWSAPEVRRRPAWRWQLLLGIPIAIALVGLAALDRRWGFAYSVPIPELVLRVVCRHSVGACLLCHRVAWRTVVAARDIGDFGGLGVRIRASPS